MTITTAAPSEAVERGRTTLADRAVKRIAAMAAVEVEDVLTAKADARVTGETTTLDVRIALRYPAPVASTTQRIRSHLTRRVEHLTGLVVSNVDITVTELQADTPPRRRVQ